MKEHNWSKRQDVVAFYLARYKDLLVPGPDPFPRCLHPAYKETVFPRSWIALYMDVEPAVLDMRIAEFRELDRRKNLESVSSSAVVVFKRYSALSKAKHRARVDFIFKRGLKSKD